jgi:H+-transporting ATPase
MTTRRRVKLALEFVQPMPLMIWAAMLLELLEAIMEDPVYWLDVGVLIVLQLLNVVVGFYEELQVRAVSMAPLPSSMSE